MVALLISVVVDFFCFLSAHCFDAFFSFKNPAFVPSVLVKKKHHVQFFIAVDLQSRR